MLEDWLAKELKDRGWTHNELARRAGVSQSSISNVLAGKKKAGAELCIKVAQALEEPPEKVLRLAGVLPQVLEDKELAELLDMLRNMTPDQRNEMLRYAKYIYRDK